MKKLYIIAGEPSGDFLGASIIEKIKMNLDFQIYGVGGILMEQAGLKSLFDIEKISVGGLIEIIPHIFAIKSLINKTVEDIIQKNPDILFTIDSPGFCFRIAKIIKRKKPNIKLVHFVAPSVWAWRKNRAKTWAKVYDQLLTLFDFEPQYFLKYGLSSIFVGHPAIEYFHECSNDKTDTLLLLPGSRKQEITALLPIFLEASRNIRLRKVVISTLPNLVELISPFIKEYPNIQLIWDEREKEEVYKTSKLALVASGTATLQLALSGCPMIVCYRLSNLTYYLLKHFVNVKYVSLVNLILNREIVPELLQFDCNPQKILQTVANLDFEKQKEGFLHLREFLKPGDSVPTEKIVKTIDDLFNIQV